MMPAAEPAVVGTAHVRAAACSPWVLLAIALSVAAGAYLSREAANSANAFSVFWPPAGIAFAALQVFGAAAIAPVAAGIAIWAMLTLGADPVMIPFAVAASVAGPWCGVRAQRVFLETAARHGEPLTRLRVLVSFYAAEALVGAPVAATLGTQGLRLAGLYPDEPVAAVWAAYWLVECLGALLFAPAIIELLLAPHGARRLRFDLPTLTGAFLLALLCRALAEAGEQDYASVMAYLFLPLVAFCGVRCDARASHWTLVVCAALILTVLALGAPPRLEPGLREFALFESALVVFVATALAQVLQAISEDRRGALAAVAKAAREDPATGLPNGRGLDEALEDRLGRRDGPGFGVIGVRLRNLDAAVDLLDAHEGARLAAAMGQTLRRVPGVFALARPETSRFVALCGTADPGHLNASAEQLLRELEAVRVAAGGVALRLAPAVGVV
jgi:GGDEF domain-containing protein